MKKTISTLLLALVILACVPATLSAASITAFYVTGSSTGVTRGTTETFNDTSNSPHAAIGACFLGDAPDSCIYSGTQDGEWGAVFAAPFGQNLTGGEYDNLSRYILDESPNPELSFYDHSLEDGQLTGYFDILQLSFTSDGQIQSLAVDFVEYNNGDTTAWDFGSMRINSDIPLNSSPSPEPSTLLMFGSGLVLILPASLGFKRRQK